MLAVPIFVLKDLPGLEYIRRVMPWRMSQVEIFTDLEQVEQAISNGLASGVFLQRCSSGICRVF